MAKDRMQKSMQVLVPKSKRLSQVGKVRVSLASPSRATDDEILSNIDIEKDIAARLNIIMVMIGKLRAGHQHMTVVLADINTRL